jgi:hypothetical protein
LIWFLTSISLTVYLPFANLARVSLSNDANRFDPGSDFPYADPDKIAGFREELSAFQMGDKLRTMIYQGNAKKSLGL